jgi:prepilin-type processing-associated H-X9-DG protein
MTNGYYSEEYSHHQPIPPSNSRFRCPSQRKKIIDGKPATNYGINETLMSLAIDLPNRNFVCWKADRTRGLLKLSSVKNSSRVCSFGDSLVDQYDIRYYFDLKYPDFRHQKQSNFSFFDGHVDNVARINCFLRPGRWDEFPPGVPWY